MPKFALANLQVGESPDLRTLVRTFKKITKMSKRKLLVTQIAKEVRVQNQDLRFDFMLNSSAEKELKSLEKMISPELYGIISKLLLGFHGHMQYEMAVDLVL